MRHNRRNPFKIGDVAGHSEHQKLQGIVTGVSGKWVRYAVLGRTLPGGKPYVVRFAHQKLFMIMTYEQRLQLAHKIYARQQAESKGLRGAVHRVAAWARNLVKSNPTPPAVSAG